MDIGLLSVESQFLISGHTWLDGLFVVIYEVIGRNQAYEFQTGKIVGSSDVQESTQATLRFCFEKGFNIVENGV